MEVYCWQCVKRTVDIPLERCFQCLDAERKRFSRSTRQGKEPTNENTHRRHRADIAEADFVKDGRRRPHPANE